MRNVTLFRVDRTMRRIVFSSPRRREYSFFLLPMGFSSYYTSLAACYWSSSFSFYLIFLLLGLGDDRFLSLLRYVWVHFGSMYLGPEEVGRL